MVSKIKEVGVINTFIGTFKMMYYTRLRKKYGFLEWSISPFELRPYIQKVAEYINENLDYDCTVVDVGCGLGELLRNVDVKHKYGFDLETESIEAAKHLNRKRDITFSVGSFDSINDMKIDALVSLNFMHGNDESYWRPVYKKVLDDNNVKMLIADSVRGTETKNDLNWNKIIPVNYKLNAKYGPFKSGRYIWVYKRLD